MERLDFNKDDLKISDMDEEVVRVKVFIINDNDEILIANSNGGCQLPGGHIEEGEELISGLIREIKEETGIELLQNDIDAPFFEIRHFTKNYKNSLKNRLSSVLYFVAKTNNKPNLENISLTESEKENNFEVLFVHKNSFEEYVSSFIENADLEINKIIAKEIIFAYEKLLSYLNNK